jgi:hypothetical protein
MKIINFDEVRAILPKKLQIKKYSIWLILSCFITFIFYYVYYRNTLINQAHWDVGWIRNVIWRNPIQSMPVDCCAVDGQNSEYISWTWHFSPTFSVFSLLSFLWPFSQLSWLVLFFTLQNVIITFCVNYLLYLKLSNKFTNFTI